MNKTLVVKVLTMEMRFGVKKPNQKLSGTQNGKILPNPKSCPLYTIHDPKSHDIASFIPNPNMYKSLLKLPSDNKTKIKDHIPDFLSAIADKAAIWSTSFILDLSPGFQNKQLLVQLPTWEQLNKLLDKNTDRYATTHRFWPASKVKQLKNRYFLSDLERTVSTNALVAPKLVSKQLLKVYEFLSENYRQIYGNDISDAARLNENNPIVFKIGNVGSKADVLAKSLGYLRSSGASEKSRLLFTDNVPTYGSVKKAEELLKNLFTYGNGHDAVMAYLMTEAIERGYWIGGTSQMPTIRDWYNATGSTINPVYKKLSQSANSLIRKGDLKNPQSSWAINPEEVARRGKFGQPMPHLDPELPGNIRDMFQQASRTLDPIGGLKKIDDPSFIQRVTQASHQTAQALQPSKSNN